MKVRLFVFSILLAAGFLMMGAGLRYPAAAADPEGSVATPRSLYIRNCARCHGSDGRAQTKLGIALGADDLTAPEVKAMAPERIARVISRGRMDMPAFGKKLRASEIASLARYIRSL